MLILISDNADDLQIVKAADQYLNMGVLQVFEQEALKTAIQQNPGAWIFWSVDHAQALENVHPMSLSKVGPILKASCPPEKIFVMSDLALSRVPSIRQHPIFNYHVFRRPGELGAFWISRVIAGREKPELFNSNFFNVENSEVTTITLTHSRNRHEAMEKISGLISTLSIPSRLAASIVQSLDELLMNAIFDAPVDPKGIRYRIEVERTGEFELVQKEVVEVKFFANSKFCCLSVRDLFGSLKREEIFKIIALNYETKEYSAPDATQTAGLGVFGIVQSGLSFILVPRPGKSTEAILLIPFVDNVKDFRVASRIFSIM